ncbi:MAG: hypothetical protein RSE94_02225 [Pseudomonas sp.]
MAITADQLNEYLAGQGIGTLPSFVTAAIVELANDSNLAECFAANGYTDAAQTMLALSLAYLLAMANYPRYITSQSAPNGASRSFSTPQLADMWRGTLSVIGAFDPANCLGDVIPQDPTKPKRYGARIGVACYGK